MKAAHIARKTKIAIDEPLDAPAPAGIDAARRARRRVVAGERAVMRRGLARRRACQAVISTSGRKIATVISSMITAAADAKPMLLRVE